MRGTWSNLGQEESSSGPGLALFGKRCSSTQAAKLVDCEPGAALALLPLQREGQPEDEARRRERECQRSLESLDISPKVR